MTGGEQEGFCVIQRSTPGRNPCGIRLLPEGGRAFGQTDKTERAAFLPCQKYLGLKPGHPEELERLEEICQELAQRLITSLP